MTQHPIHSPCFSYGLTDAEQQRIHEHREVSKHLILQNDRRFVMIVGPCSIHHHKAAIEYAYRLKKLQEEVQNSIAIWMRVFLEKPRTCHGWTGFINQTNGIEKSRNLLKELTQLNLPLATEVVNPMHYPFIEEYISWGFVGARTTQSPIHRHLASGMPFPVGFKNTTEGTLEIPVQSVATAMHPQQYLMHDGFYLKQHQSTGNRYAHVVLRGDDKKPNYSIEYIKQIQALQNSYLNISNPILIDCAHGNSQKQPQKQLSIAEEVLSLRETHTLPILGVMLESYFKSGTQQEQNNDPYISITDPCLSWEETEKLILHLHQKIKKPTFCAV